MPKYISALLCAFIFGVALASVYVLPLHVVLEMALAGSGIAAVILLRSKILGISLLCVIIGTAFGLWYVERSFGVNQYQNLLGQNIDLEGDIAGDPTYSQSGFSNKMTQKLVLLPDGFSQQMNVSMFNPIPGASKGDRVWIRGQVQLPDNFSGFDYIGYLQRYGIYAELKKPKVIRLEPAPWSWRTPLRAVHDYVVRRTAAYAPSEGSLILGILIGERTSIPDDVLQAFKRTGLTHIVAVSGFNMTIIATACGSLVWWIGRRATNILVLFVVFAFVVITGATASVVRAAIMAVLMVVGQLLGRQYTSLYALLIVCAIMVLQNPRIVIWDIGFQLSVAATFGVLIAFKLKTPGTPNTFLSDTLRPTLGAIAVTAPIQAYHFQTFSVIAPLANLIVLPSVSWIMLLGALALVPIIGNAFVYPAQLLTTLALFATMELSKIPYASISVHLPTWLLGVYYLFFFGYIYMKLRRSPRTKAASLQNQVNNARI